MGLQYYFETFINRLLGGGLRYFFFAILAWLIFYKIFKSRPFLKKIQPKFQKLSDYKREILHTIMTLAIFTAAPLILLTPQVQPYTTIYKDFESHSLILFFLMFPIMFFLHDTYFYWTHRLMHWKVIYRWIHLTHHKSNNPGPFTAFSFDPLESLISTMIIIFFSLTLPLHPLNIVLFLIIQYFHVIYIHMGFEIMPKGLNKHWLGKYLCTSVNHNMHHQYYVGNYGLYFNFWDRWMGTLNPMYDKTYEKTAGLLNTKNQE